jgi:hypothetical protein
VKSAVYQFLNSSEGWEKVFDIAFFLCTCRAVAIMTLSAVVTGVLLWG